MVWSFAAAIRGHIAAAALALLVAAAATSGVPYAFKLIIDKGFSGAGTRRYRPLVRISVAAGRGDGDRHRGPLLFRLLARRADVADIRLAVQRNLLRLSPGFFEENRPAEITQPHHRRHDDHRAGGRHHSLGRAAQPRPWDGLRGHPVRARAEAGGLMLLGVPLVSCRSPCSGRACARSRASQDRIADVGTVTSEVLGAMKIVQAFNQQSARPSASPRRPKRVFATAKKRIVLRAVMTAIVIFLMFRIDHHDHLAGRDRRRRGPHDRRDHRRLRALRRAARRGVRRACPKSMATCCAPPARRNG